MALAARGSPIGCFRRERQVSWRVTSKRAGFQVLKPRRAGGTIVGRSSLAYGVQSSLPLFEGGEREAAQAARKPETDKRVVAGAIATREFVAGDAIHTTSTPYVPTIENVRVTNYA